MADNESADNVSEDNWEGYIRTLMYPVLFKNELASEVDRVISLNSHVYTNNASPGAYVTAIRYALGSDTRISELLPFSQPEESLRSFLAEMLRRLEAIVRDDSYNGDWPRR
jgi:hypothetical protein